MYTLIKERLQDSINEKQRLVENMEVVKTVSELANAIVFAIQNNGKLVLCGNGGSASDALHFAGEITGRFRKERMPWPAMVLNADVATMTAIANDYGYDEMFARQAEGNVYAEDVFIGISTSGNSENVYRAVKAAGKKGAKTAALLGGNGGKIGRCVDHPIIVPCSNTARVQECHITLIHIICEIVEEKLG